MRLRLILLLVSPRGINQLAIDQSDARQKLTVWYWQYTQGNILIGRRILFLFINFLFAFIVVGIHQNGDAWWLGSYCTVWIIIKSSFHLNVNIVARCKWNGLHRGKMAFIKINYQRQHLKSNMWHSYHNDANRVFNMARQSHIQQILTATSE